MMISQYNSFLNEAEEVRPMKEKKLMRFFISKRFYDLLMKLMKSGDYQVKTSVNRIIGLTKSDELFDRSYFDLVDGSNDTISFMPTPRAWKAMNFENQEDANQEPTPDCPMWKATGRQTFTVTKLLTYLFDDFSPLTVDKFGNSIKAELAALYIYDNFKVVYGEEIRKWYSEKSYAQVGGNLNTSCMRYDNDRQSCQSFFDIYCDNPEKCGLLILTDSNNKLLGRALVWKDLRKPTDKVLMDRIYSTKQSEEELFKKYAMEKGWLYKYNQAANDYSYIENGQRIQKNLSLQLKPKTFKKYPYMDTFIYYNPGTGRLASDSGNPVEGKKRIRMQDTNGGFQIVD